MAVGFVVESITKMTAKEFLKSKGYSINAIKHPQDMSLISSEINLFKVMEEYCNAEMSISTRKNDTNPILEGRNCSNIVTGVIERLFGLAQEMAIHEVERLAREHLQQNEYLNEFVIAMGTYFFKGQDGEICYDETCKPLDDLIDKFDEIFSLTGHSMRFTAESKITTHW